MKSAPAAFLLLGLTACGAERPPLVRPTAPAPITLAIASDLDRDPNAVAVRLTAASTAHEVLAGHATELLSYSGAYPGPLIRAKRGDRLRVELENRLSEPTTLHFHGMRVPNAMDGVPDVTQPAVLPGARFTYDFVVPDAGLFWYHPHHDSLAALGAGSLGAILVDDPEDERELGDEVVLILSDLSLDEWGARIPEPDDAATIMAGREGNVVLVNGRLRPILVASPGRRQRWRVLNAARSRYFRLGLAGHSFLQIGSDGGRLESPVEVTEPVVTPGERLDLLVDPQGAPGASTELVALPLTRGLPLDASEPVTLLELRVGQPSGRVSPELPTLARTLSPLEPAGATEVPLVLSMDESEEGAPLMGINGAAGTHGEPIHARVGETQLLVVDNQTPFDHPFHLHGFFFEELDARGDLLLPRQRKDTINLPPLTTRRLLIRYDDRPGTWMFHCHILDHAQAGMMGMIHLTP